MKLNNRKISVDYEDSMLIYIISYQLENEVIFLEKCSDENIKFNIRQDAIDYCRRLMKENCCDELLYSDSCGTLKITK